MREMESSIYTKTNKNGQLYCLSKENFRLGSLLLAESIRVQQPLLDNDVPKEYDIRNENIHWFESKVIVLKLLFCDYWIIVRLLLSMCS